MVSRRLFARALTMPQSNETPLPAWSIHQDVLTAIISLTRDVRCPKGFVRVREKRRERIRWLVTVELKATERAALPQVDHRRGVEIGDDADDEHSSADGIRYLTRTVDVDASRATRHEVDPDCVDTFFRAHPRVGDVGDAADLDSTKHQDLRRPSSAAPSLSRSLEALGWAS